MWAVMAAIPDVEEYFAIFDDYLDFDIKPWDEHGFDQGLMIPERKVAIRYLTLAMNIHKSDPALLPTNLLTFMSEYQKPDYQQPEKLDKVMGRYKNKSTKYSDLREEVAVNTADNNTKVTVKAGNTHAVPSSGLSAKSMEGFDMRVRQGARTSDVIEKTETKFAGHGKMGPKYLDTTTRSVFWDVPGEDSLSQDTWDWKTYAPAEDHNRVTKVKGGAKTTK